MVSHFILGTSHFPKWIIFSIKQPPKWNNIIWIGRLDIIDGIHENWSQCVARVQIGLVNKSGCSCKNVLRINKYTIQIFSPFAPLMNSKHSFYLTQFFHNWCTILNLKNTKVLKSLYRFRAQIWCLCAIWILTFLVHEIFTNSSTICFEKKFINNY
jgi:hypothetical protein